MASITKNFKFLGGAIQCIGYGKNVRKFSSSIKCGDINKEYYQDEDDYLTQQAIYHSTDGICSTTKPIEKEEQSRFKYKKTICVLPKKVNYKPFSETLGYDKYYHTMAFIHSNNLSVKDYQKYEKYFDSN